MGQTTAVRADSAAIRKQFASIIELDDAVAEQAPALAGLIRYYPCCEVVRCGPFRAPRLMLTHGFPPSGDFVVVSLLAGAGGQRGGKCSKHCSLPRYCRDERRLDAVSG